MDGWDTCLNGRHCGVRSASRGILMYTFTALHRALKLPGGGVDCGGGFNGAGDSASEARRVEGQTSSYPSRLHVLLRRRSQMVIAGDTELLCRAHHGEDQGAELITLIRLRGEADPAPDHIGSESLLADIVRQRNTVVLEESPAHVFATEQTIALFPSGDGFETAHGQSAAVWRRPFRHCPVARSWPRSDE